MAKVAVWHIGCSPLRLNQSVKERNKTGLPYALRVVLSMVALVSAGGPLDVQAHTSRSDAQKCQALANADFSMVPDAQTRVTVATRVIANADSPEHCDI